jgi:hypothetical protein
MPLEHAVLSASSSHRWMRCTPSARLELEFEGETSQAAAEGSAAHALAEHKLKRALKLRSKRPTSPFEDDAMDEYTTDYVSFVMEQFYEMKDGAEEDPLVLIEQQLDFSSYVPDGFGTGDAVLLASGKLHVIDFKYGQGVLVDAEQNSQMMLYALAALKKYNRKYKVKRVSMSIFQPRRENVSTWTITAAELRKWAKTVLMPKAKAAWNGDGEYIPGSHCQFCKAAVKCRARAEEKLKLAQREFSLPPLLSDEEIEEILAKLPDITKWANELMAYATEAALMHGKEWKGFKVVEGRSVRKYSDEDAVAEAANKAGYRDIYTKKLIGITEMQKLMGKAEFEKVIAPLLIKPPGKPTLVPSSDKRPAINLSNATTDFNEIMED